MSMPLCTWQKWQKRASSRLIHIQDTLRDSSISGIGCQLGAQPKIYAWKRLWEFLLFEEVSINVPESSSEDSEGRAASCKLI